VQSARAHRATVAALLVLGAALVVWLATRPTDKQESEVLPIHPPVPAAAPVGNRLDTASGASTPDAREPTPAAPANPIAPKERPEPVQETPNLQAKAPLDIIVVDDKSQPVFDAEVALRGMRSETDRGSWYAYRGEHPTARTNAEGRARIEAWVWVNVDGKTSAVDLEVSHPDHPPFRDSSFPFGPGEHRVQLAPASRVVVHAWTGSPARPVGNITVQMEPDTGVPATAWMLEGADWVTTRLAPGLHSIQVSSPSSSPQLFSEVFDFTVVAGETKELPLELLAAETLEGRLADEVPRPVVDGHVFVAVLRADFTDAYQTIWRKFEGSVAADGTFAIPNVPRGRAYLFALTRGWSSRRVKTDDAREAGVQGSKALSPEENAFILEDLGDRAWVLQNTLLPQVERPLLVAMLPTGIVEILVRDEAGAPVSEVRAGVSPNILIPRVGTMLVPWRDWLTLTDAQGLARIADIPPEDLLWASAASEHWRLRARDRQSLPEVNVKSGETVRIELVVEPNDPNKK